MREAGESPLENKDFQARARLQFFESQVCSSALFLRASLSQNRFPLLWMRSRDKVWLKIDKFVPEFFRSIKRSRYLISNSKIVSIKTSPDTGDEIDVDVTSVN